MKRTIINIVKSNKEDNSTFDDNASLIRARTYISTLHRVLAKANATFHI